MAESILNAPHFQTEEAAFAYVESKLWPDGPVCPHCGCAKEHVGALKGKTTRLGLYKCYGCKKPFTVRMGTIFESSHLALNLWLQAIHLMCASKKGISTRQLQRMFQCSMKTAWFLTHRIREAMRDNSLPPLGGSGKIVEMDETFIGGKEKNKHASKRTAGNRGGVGKEAVFALVERGGSVRSHHVPAVNSETLKPILKAQLARETLLFTDDNRTSKKTAMESGHQTDSVNHSIGEYVRGDVYTNTIEGYFSILKRGITGVYHHVSEAHLHRYLSEFDFRYSNRERLGVNDKARAELALLGVRGKRLTYETTAETSA